MHSIGKTVLASNVKHRGAAVFDGSGELQAGSNKDALAMIASAMEVMASGAQVETENEAAEAEASAKRKAVTAAIMQAPGGDIHHRAGAEMAGTIRTTVNKSGFMRQILQYEELQQGDIPRVEVDELSAIAAVLTGPTQARLQVLRENLITPPEFDIRARIYIEAVRLNQSRRDLLQEKYNDGLEAILVQEDRTFIVAADALVAQSGNLNVHIGTTPTPAVLATGIGAIRDSGLPLGAILLSSNLWTSISLDVAFGELIDPVSRLEMVRTGMIGRFYEGILMTDATRAPNLKVMDPNAIYYTSTPEYTGEYTDRGGVNAEPITSAHTAIAGAGWDMTESMSMILPNARAIAKTVLR